MRNTNTALVILGIIIVLIIIWGAATNWWRPKTVTPTPAPVTNTQIQSPVSIKNMAFEPADVTVAVGDMVVWTNNDNVSHTVVSDTNVFNSPTLNSGQTFQFTFDQAGDFPYHCSIHPNMKAVVHVQ